MDGGTDLQALQIGRTVEHHGLGDLFSDIDRAHDTPVLAGLEILTPEDVILASH